MRRTNCPLHFHLEQHHSGGDRCRRHKEVSDFNFLPDLFQWRDHDRLRATLIELMTELGRGGNAVPTRGLIPNGCHGGGRRADNDPSFVELCAEFRRGSNTISTCGAVSNRGHSG